MTTHYYYAEGVARGVPLQNLENLDNRGWLNRIVGMAIGARVMRVVHLNANTIYFPIPKAPTFSEIEGQVAYTVSVEDGLSHCTVLVPRTSPDVARHGYHYLSKTPEVPVVYRDETGQSCLTGLVFADQNTPDELSKQLGLEQPMPLASPQKRV